MYLSLEIASGIALGMTRSSLSFPTLCGRHYEGTPQLNFET
ncbi:hypothetical protein DFO77_11794 [Marinilabilia salmonicolor]|jgi:hypothetical protein|uniref:Uncharacterized protein n=1 Tax=Marinilabilia salmonicolor TaxID=989 RepID=A0A368US17_9BACT|nr:hypothetical protein DFO77_11794 [Marinilabilia salmonicolor]